MKKPEDITTRLKIAKKKAKKYNENNKNQNSSSLGSAFKLSTEMVASVFVGATIGFILDNWFDSKPWLTILFFFIGVSAGILNVVRSAKRMQKNIEKV